ncbi:MAG: MBL fold metallo-hydrolase [Bryobacter sp.]|nr:MBL fold metallo-hydrolase [Bryobacter sp.]
MRTLLAFFLLALSLLSAKDLEIYFIDVEGGQATLIVSPSGESLLVDTGWPGFNGRDADRIAKQAKKVGVKQIDWLLITHYHTDHVGGITLLMDRMTVRNIISHGPNTETGKNAEQLSKQYQEALQSAKELIVKPGDTIPVKGLEIEVISARGNLIPGPAAKLSTGAGPNPHCAGVQPKAADPTENGKSIGFLLKYGNFRFLDLADLTWNLEMDLACPTNKLGKVDLYLTNHHGLFSSNNPAFTHALGAKAMVLNNGDKKGGEIEALDSLRKAPGLQGFWQLHYSIKAGKEHNVEDPYIANLTSPGGFHIAVTVKKDGRFTVLNQRNKFSKSY